MSNENIDNAIELYKQLVKREFTEKDGYLIPNKAISKIIKTVSQSVNISDQTIRMILKSNGLARRTRSGVMYKNINMPIYDAKEQIYLNPIEITALEYGYPPALAKACCDYFENALKLKTGETIFYSKAKPISKEWVFIDGINDTQIGLQGKSEALLDVPFARGMEIRVSEIVWCADAPNGS
jgi:hypothetical protein